MKSSAFGDTSQKYQPISVTQHEKQLFYFRETYCMLCLNEETNKRASKSIIFQPPSSSSSVLAFAKDEDRNIISLSVLDSNPAESSRPRIKSIYCQDALRENTRGECARGERRANTTPQHTNSFNQ
jgi:hypothetical protein